MPLALFFGLCLIISGIVIRVGMQFAGHMGVLDHPGGHKQHDTSTPFVGGFGIITVVLSALFLSYIFFPELSPLPIATLALGTTILFATGLADDVWHLNFKTRFVIQALVAMAMVYIGGVELHSLGILVPGISVELGSYALPVTVFATIGLINALNMIDGIDGLSGTLSFISLGFMALAATLAQNDIYLAFIVAVMGGVAGFLYFNLRYPSNSRARVFLGDNGSMLLGFVFAWLFISLSQGEQRAMPPVTALWLFGVPLLDTVSVMLRRIWHGKSPFLADRNHLHHLFLKAGFRVSDTVWCIALLQLSLGLAGIIGMRLDFPEPLMFGSFLIVFAVYFYVIARPWRFVPNLRQLNIALGLPTVHARGVFVGYFDTDGSSEVIDTLTNDLGSDFEYHLSLQKIDHKPHGSRNIYALIEIVGSQDDVSVGEIRRLMNKIKSHLSATPDVQVRLFMHRNDDNDRRLKKDSEEQFSEDCSREKDRRSAKASSAFYTATVRSEIHETNTAQV